MNLDARNKICNGHLSHLQGAGTPTTRVGDALRDKSVRLSGGSCPCDRQTPKTYHVTYGGNNLSEHRPGLALG